MALHRLDSIVLGVPDLDSATAFYEDFGLAHVGEAPVRHARRGPSSSRWSRHRPAGWSPRRSPSTMPTISPAPNGTSPRWGWPPRAPAAG